MFNLIIFFRIMFSRNYTVFKKWELLLSILKRNKKKNFAKFYIKCTCKNYNTLIDKFILIFGKKYLKAIFVSFDFSVYLNKI